METFEFNTFIDVQAENYDEAIDVFQFQLKYGIDKDNVYVADIKELTIYNNESVEV
jgi:hypothetical protein